MFEIRDRNSSGLSLYGNLGSSSSSKWRTLENIGGPGWANYAASYFNDTNRFCRVVSQVLKPGGRAVVVIGNSILQGVEISLDNILSDLAARHCLVTENIH